MKLNTKTVIDWMNVIRYEENNRDRILESFWNSQLYSKEWLCDHLPRFDIPAKVVIHGGWYGVLSSILLDNIPVEEVRSVDIDPSCERLVKMMNPDPRVVAETCDMTQYIYRSIPDIVINTSCEHITEYQYQDWFENIPNDSLIVVQSNNAFYIDEHINCKDSLEEFSRSCMIRNPIFSGTLQTAKFDRYMVIGWK